MVARFGCDCRTLVAGTLLVVASALGCEKSGQSAPSAPGPTLSGPRVVRYRTPSYFRERERYVLKGERTGRGCLYRSSAKAGFGAEWVVEQDGSTCTQVRARGDVIGPIDNKAGHSAISVRTGPVNRP